MLPASTFQIGSTDAVLQFCVYHAFVSRPEQMHHEHKTAIVCSAKQELSYEYISNTRSILNTVIKSIICTFLLSGYERR